MDPAHESGDLHDVHDVVPTPDLREANLWIGIRSEPGPHELSSQTSKLNTPNPPAFHSKSIPSVIVGFRRRAKGTALGVRPSRNGFQAELGRTRLSLFCES
jgi:hypothetical protein